MCVCLSISIGKGVEGGMGWWSRKQCFPGSLCPDSLGQISKEYSVFPGRYVPTRRGLVFAIVCDRVIWMMERFMIGFELKTKNLKTLRKSSLLETF